MDVIEYQRNGQQVVELWEILQEGFGKKNMIFDTSVLLFFSLRVCASVCAKNTKRKKKEKLEKEEEKKNKMKRERKKEEDSSPQNL